jgi:hypothetical protein
MEPLPDAETGVSGNPGLESAGEDSCFNESIPRSGQVWVFGLSSARDVGDCGEGTNRANGARAMEPLPDAGYGVSGSWGLAGAGGPVAVCLSAFGEQVGWVLVRLGATRGQGRRCSAVEVVEDLADEAGIGDIPNDPQLSTA